MYWEDGVIDNDHKMEVLKFGGSSLVSAEAMARVREVLLARRGEQRIVVCSAMGGVTNDLLRIGLRASQGDDSHLELLAHLRKRHLETLASLDLTEDLVTLNEISHSLDELQSLCKGIQLIRELSAKTMDQLVSYGERLAVPMVCAWLEQGGLKVRRVDAREWICTDENFGAAQVDLQRTNEKIREGVKSDLDFEILITEGFIGKSLNGDTTTLGRGGSDYTASLIASAIKAKFMEKSTDVPGMLTADPRLVPGARVIEEMSYEEAMELCHFGAKVIYHPTIAPLRAQNIPLIVRSTFESDSPGTRIVSEPSTKAVVRGLSSVDGLALITFEGGELIGRPGFSSRIFSALAQASINVTLITQSSSENSLTIGIEDSDLDAAIFALESDLKSDIDTGRLGALKVDRDLSLVALVGGGMVSSAGVSGKAFKALGDAHVNVRAIAQGSTERNITLVVGSEDVPAALRALHNRFFDSSSNERRIQVFCAGLGQVGQSFLSQFKATKGAMEEQLGHKIDLVGMANSRSFAFDADGINDGLELISRGLVDSSESIEAVHQQFIAMPGSMKIWVDNSASAQVADLALTSIDRGVGYVCSNKIASSRSFEEFTKLMNSPTGRLLFRNETNVGAALPVISSVHKMIETGDAIYRIEAVLSGSLNFIFSSLDQGRKFKDAVSEAKTLGYTEPDPRLDLSGTDVARKILILARLAGDPLELSQVHIESFMPLLPEDLTVERFMDSIDGWGPSIDELAQSNRLNGNRLRFVASWTREEGCRCELRPIDSSHPFYGLEGTDNSVAIHSNRYSARPLVIKGAGAGGELTASGVLADLYEVCHNQIMRNQ
ncbi:MAG: bifunctional aspartate kinase/homoserine dehydrogenase I [Flavobacteriales bacterium]